MDPQRNTPSVPATAARMLRITAILLGAWALGAALCVMKGDAGDALLVTLGNLSAPYAITGVLAGLVARRSWTVALLGVAATDLTLGGFYWAYASILGHEVAAATLIFWGGLGLPLGAVCGLIGYAAITRPALRYVIPALLILEPLALRAEFITSRFGFGQPDVTPIDLLASAIEIAVGIALLLAVRAHLLHRRRHHATSGIPSH